ncbi:hypothetical protein GCM10023169_01020 [Georgenia halophila]|uniref:Hpt domain-containing protein n=1 Tax=Georgenia halophila TaxID=620889 RepID=A0ABP8KTD4_9MICO
MIRRPWKQASRVSMVMHEVVTVGGRAQVYEVLLDPRALQALVEDLGEEATENFVRRYVHELPIRVVQLQLAMASGDLRRECDVAQSLASTSAMVGASCLNGIALDWAAATGHGGPTPGSAGLTRLAKVACATLSVFDDESPGRITDAGGSRLRALSG